jgi:hypothetical protein
MEVVYIFANLYAIRYQDDDPDEFEKAFDLWNDPSYLYEFFESNKGDLQNGFLGNITIEQAVERTLDEAGSLEQTLLRLAGNDPEETNNTLDLLFKPLDKRQYNAVVLSKQKAYGSGHNSWLRVYALKIDPGYYIITGSAIKLTPNMNEREHTQKELAKLDRCRAYLQEQGLLDKEGFKEI